MLVSLWIDRPRTLDVLILDTGHHRIALVIAKDSVAVELRQKLHDLHFYLDKFCIGSRAV